LIETVRLTALTRLKSVSIIHFQRYMK